MRQTFDEWLSPRKTDDENREYTARRMDELRQKLKDELSRYFEETKDECWCNCDTCVLIRLKNRDLTDSLAVVGTQYLLGENFNGAAANYYGHYLRDTEEL